MFLLVPLRVDWQMFCLSYSVMFACQHSFFFCFFFHFFRSCQLCARAQNRKNKTGSAVQQNIPHSFHIALELKQLDQTLPSRRANSMKRFRL